MKYFEYNIVIKIGCYLHTKIKKTTNIQWEALHTQISTWELRQQDGNLLKVNNRGYKIKYYMYLL